jgi:FAD/FMN-containing dehydrogenase
VRFARERGLAVAPQGTGHGAATLGALDDTVLLRTIRMGVVEIDPSSSRARVQAGAVWGELGVAAAGHGLAGLGGSSGTVGVVGYTLGGGIGWLARRHGLACNSVHAIELVGADGRLSRVDRDHDAELFWALRGGGGSFGVLTAIELELYPIGEVYGGMIAWPAELGAEVLDRYLALTQAAPDELSAIFRLLNLPPIPAVPEPFRGRRIVAVDAVYLGTDEAGAELLASVRSIGGALIDTFAMMPARELSSLHGEPDQPHPGIGNGITLSSLNAEGAERLVALGSDGPLVSLELRHLGGALAVPARDGGALEMLEGEYVLYGVGSPMNEDAGAAIDAHLDLVGERMDPWRTACSYLNFADRQPTAAGSFAPGVYRRLQAVKRSYDPANMFRSNHQVLA